MPKFPIRIFVVAEQLPGEIESFMVNSSRLWATQEDVESSDFDVWKRQRAGGGLPSAVIYEPRKYNPYTLGSDIANDIILAITEQKAQAIAGLTQAEHEAVKKAVGMAASIAHAELEQTLRSALAKMS